MRGGRGGRFGSAELPVDRGSVGGLWEGVPPQARSLCRSSGTRVRVARARADRRSRVDRDAAPLIICCCSWRLCSPSRPLWCRTSRRESSSKRRSRSTSTLLVSSKSTESARTRGSAGWGWWMVNCRSQETPQPNGSPSPRRQSRPGPGPLRCVSVLLYVAPRRIFVGVHDAQRAEAGAVPDWAKKK